MLLNSLKTGVVAVLATTGLFATGAAPASAASWSRQISVTHSAPHQISSTRTYTGPNGRSVTRTGSASCNDGACTHSSTVTGPNGNTVTRTGGTECGPYACVHGSTATGPEGNSVRTVGGWWR
jgi:hypothetical protein